MCKCLCVRAFGFDAIGVTIIVNSLQGHIDDAFREEGVSIVKDVKGCVRDVLPRGSCEHSISLQQEDEPPRGRSSCQVIFANTLGAELR